jgi:hypothetical protein
VSGLGLIGNGCVGHAASPSASVGGTGRSSTPKIGSPVSDSEEQQPGLGPCTIAGMRCRCGDVREHRRRVQIAVVDVVVRRLEMPLVAPVAASSATTLAE